MLSLVNDISSYAATAVRLGRGIYPIITRDKRPRRARLLELYDYEACPYCRRVREVLCELDLDVLVHPVARGSRRRERLKRLGGKMQVPYLVDQNTDTSLYESSDIIAYLQATYGPERRWRIPVPQLVDTYYSFVASALRAGRGWACTDGLDTARRPAAPLELYNMEGSPYCRKVREVLCELDLDYIARNVPKGSPKRRDLERRGGKVQVPYLIDPTTGVALYESDDIILYLKRTYGPGSFNRSEGA